MRSSFHSSPERIDLLVYTALGGIRFSGFSQSKEGAVIVCSESNKNADPRRRFGSNVNIIHLDTGHQRSATFRKRQTNRFKRNPFKLSFLDRSAVEQRRGEMNPYNSYAPNSLELGGLTDLKNELQIDGIPIGIDFL